jgi:hypothetical protein
LKKSKGAYLYDSRTKTNFLDMFSFFASWPVSHNHPKLHEPHYLKTVVFGTQTARCCQSFNTCFSLSSSSLLLLESTLLTPTSTLWRWLSSLRHLSASLCRRSLYIFSLSKVVLLLLRMGNFRLSRSNTQSTSHVLLFVVSRPHSIGRFVRISLLVVASVALW